MQQKKHPIVNELTEQCVTQGHRLYEVCLHWQKTSGIPFQTKGCCSSKTSEDIDLSKDALYCSRSELFIWDSEECAAFF